MLKSDIQKDLFDEEFIRKLEYWALVFRRLYGGELSASHRSKQVGSGIEFSDRREYVAGDDFRYIDWGALGRMDRALVRLFLEEKDLKVNILIDTSSSMSIGTPPKIESAVKLAACISYMILFNLDRVGFSIFADGLKDYSVPARGKARIKKILDELKNIKPEGKTDIIKAAREISAYPHGTGLFIIISDLLFQEGFDECIRRLQYEGSEVSVIRTIAPEDEKPVFRGDVQIVDSETGEKMFVTATESLISKFTVAFQSMSKELESIAIDRGVKFITIYSNMPFDDQISMVLRSMAQKK